MNPLESKRSWADTHSGGIERPGGISARALGDRHRAVDIKGKVSTNGIAAPRRIPHERSDVCKRRADARFPLAHVEKRLRASSKRLQAMRRNSRSGDTTRSRGRAHQGRAQRDRPEDRPHVRHQQRWDVRQAISIGKGWTSTTVLARGRGRTRRLSRARRGGRALSTPIAAGEYVYGCAFRHMLEARSVDIVMVDVLRAGGITQW